MEYQTYTSQVKELINKSHSYSLLELELRVDGTGYIVAKSEEGKYFQTTFTNLEMKQPAETLAKGIILLLEINLK